MDGPVTVTIWTNKMVVHSNRHQCKFKLSFAYKLSGYLFTHKKTDSTGSGAGNLSDWRFKCCSQWFILALSSASFTWHSLPTKN